MKQKGLWSWLPELRINKEKLKEKIIRSFFEQGFVMDFGNGLVAENYEEFKDIYDKMLKEVKGK